MKKMKTSIAVILMNLMIATTFGCGGGGGQVSSGSSPVKISISGLNRTGARSALNIKSASVASIGFTISAPDMQTQTSTVLVTGSDTITASFPEVPNGSNRHFLAVAFAADNSVLYQGDAYSDLNGTPTNIDIEMGVDVSGNWTFTCTPQGNVAETDFITFSQTGNSLSLVETTTSGSSFNGTGTISGNDIQFSVVGFACGNPANLMASGSFFADGSLSGTYTATGGGSGSWVAVTGQSLPLAVQPTTQTIVGSSGGTASFTISGGRAPYTVSPDNPSFPPSPASVTASGGSFTVTVPAGTTAATVTYTINDSAGATVAATLNITAASLASIAVTPANSSLAVGATQQFTAIGTYSDGTTKNLTTQVIWNSSQTAIATVNSSGLATAVSAGTTTIAATLGNVSGNATLTVTQSSASAPFIVAFVGSFGAGSNPQVLIEVVSVFTDSTGTTPITNATVTINGTLLPFSNGAYVGILATVPGAAVNLSVIVGSTTYTASGTQYATLPSITTPPPGATWQVANANTITWTAGAPTAGSSYFVYVIDNNGNFVYPAGGRPVEVSTSSTTYTIPANSLPAGSYSLYVDIATAGLVAGTGGISIPNAAAGSGLWLIGATAGVPITVQ